MSRNIRKLKLKVDTTPNPIPHDLKDKVQHNPINNFNISSDVHPGHTHVSNTTAPNNISSDVLPGHTHGNTTASDVLPVGKLKNEKVEKLKNEKESLEKLKNKKESVEKLNNISDINN